MYWKPFTELRSVTCHMGSHSVTCHPTQANGPRLNPSHAGRYLPTPEGWKAELTLVVGYILRYVLIVRLPSHQALVHIFAKYQAMCETLLPTDSAENLQ